jgi:hypothetical protein
VCEADDAIDSRESVWTSSAHSNVVLSSRLHLSQGNTLFSLIDFGLNKVRDVLSRLESSEPNLNSNLMELKRRRSNLGFPTKGTSHVRGRRIWWNIPINRFLLIQINSMIFKKKLIDYASIG